MPQPWARMDNDWQTNLKFVSLHADRAYKAIAVYWGSIAYSSGHQLGGFIPGPALPLIWAGRREREQLVAAGLWEPVDGGYLIHDWDDYQPTSDEIRERSKRAQYAALQRWHPDKRR
jgi:hypothetical protein